VARSRSLDWPDWLASELDQTRAADSPRRALSAIAPRSSIMASPASASESTLARLYEARQKTRPQFFDQLAASGIPRIS
jgi:hypothetical protein